MKTQKQQPKNVSHVIQGKTKASRQAPIEQILQRYQARTVQRQDIDEDDLLQGKFSDTAQRVELDEEEPLQAKIENKTGLPDNLKSGIENLSGYSMDDVRVHYNSDKPAQLQALAYTQGADIHVAPGQEKHLPHEAWHVVQQKQGRVQPTMQLQGINVNDNEGLEKEADVMGKGIESNIIEIKETKSDTARSSKAIQARWIEGCNPNVYKWDVIIHGLQWYKRNNDDYAYSTELNLEAEPYQHTYKTIKEWIELLPFIFFPDVFFLDETIDEEILNAYESYFKKEIQAWATANELVFDPKSFMQRKHEPIAEVKKRAVESSKKSSYSFDDFFEPLFHELFPGSKGKVFSYRGDSRVEKKLKPDGFKPRVRSMGPKILKETPMFWRESLSDGEPLTTVSLAAYIEAAVRFPEINNSKEFVESIKEKRYKSIKEELNIEDNRKNIMKGIRATSSMQIQNKEYDTNVSVIAMDPKKNAMDPIQESGGDENYFLGGDYQVSEVTPEEVLCVLPFNRTYQFKPTYYCRSEDEITKEKLIVANIEIENIVYDLNLSEIQCEKSQIKDKIKDLGIDKKLNEKLNNKDGFAQQSDVIKIVYKYKDIFSETELKNNEGLQPKGSTKSPNESMDTTI